MPGAPSQHLHARAAPGFERSANLPAAASAEAARAIRRWRTVRAGPCVTPACRDLLHVAVTLSGSDGPRLRGDGVCQADTGFRKLACSDSSARVPPSAFELWRVSSDVLSRLMPAVPSQRLHAQAAAGLERSANLPAAASAVAARPRPSAGYGPRSTSRPRVGTRSRWRLALSRALRRRHHAGACRRVILNAGWADDSSGGDARSGWVRNGRSVTTRLRD